MDKDTMLFILLFAMSVLLNLAFLIVILEVYRNNKLQDEQPKKRVLNAEWKGHKDR